MAGSSTNGGEMDRGEEVIVKMPYFQTSGQNMLVNEGSTIKLPCIVNRLGKQDDMQTGFGGHTSGKGPTGRVQIKLQ